MSRFSITWPLNLAILSWSHNRYVSRNPTKKASWPDRWNVNIQLNITTKLKNQRRKFERVSQRASAGATCGWPPNGLNYLPPPPPPLEKINWNPAVQYHPIQCILFLCNTYRRQPSIRFYRASCFIYFPCRKLGLADFFLYYMFHISTLQTVTFTEHSNYVFGLPVNEYDLSYGNDDR